MFKNAMRPVHPGEVLREDYLKPLSMSANALAKALSVPAPRINDVIRGRRGISADTAMRLARFRWRCAFVAKSPERLRSARSGNQQRQAHWARGFTRRPIGRKAKQKEQERQAASGQRTKPLAR
jgi:addiction module HigA family antidote